jgi:hypothetical protein
MSAFKPWCDLHFGDQALQTVPSNVLENIISKKNF